jgi:curved DNA-binding protein CbpA
MAKIHTHYDNLKVARGAPQEVVRAAYKALSQKYHPDKNQGDEKAARIMAIVNTAYNILSDPVRRKEHDEWIAAEEWEVEWLESSGEEGAARGVARGYPRRSENWETPPPAPRPRRRLLRDPRWWLGLLGGVAVGAVCVLVLLQPRVLPAALAFNAKEQAAALTSVPNPDPGRLGQPGRRQGRRPGQNAGRDPAAGAGAPARVRHRPDHPGRAERRSPGPSSPATSRLPARQQRPRNDGRGRQQRQRRRPVFVKIYDLERRSNVRHAYVLGNGTLTIDGLAAGKYEVRYQNVVEQRRA